MTFRIECCERRRGILPGGVLLCPTCDFNHDGATVVPNATKVRDAPKHAAVWHPSQGQP